MNFQLAIVSINTNVVISQSACCTTDDIHNIVEVFLDNVRVSILVSLTIIASKLHAVVVSCHFVILTVFIFVNDTSHGIARRTIYTRNTVFYGNISSCIFTIFACRASQTNVANTILTRDGYSVFTVCTRDAYLTVIAINTSCSLWTSNGYTIMTRLTILTIYNDLIEVSKVFVQCICVSKIAVCFFLFNSQVLTCCIGYSLATSHWFYICCRTCCKITTCISIEAVVVTRSYVKSREVDNSLRATYSLTITIIISQCNCLIRCIVLVNISRARCCTTFIFCSTCGWCNVQFRCLQGIMNRFQLVFCCSLTRCEVIRIEGLILQATNLTSLSIESDAMVTINSYCLVRTEGQFTRTIPICDGGDINQSTFNIYLVWISSCTRAFLLSVLTIYQYSFSVF